MHQNAGRLFYSQKNELFSKNNAENDCFDQRLECAAPKRWSKNTTNKTGPKTLETVSFLWASQHVKNLGQMTLMSSFLMVSFLYLSIWIDIKPIVLDSFVVMTDNKKFFGSAESYEDTGLVICEVNNGQNPFSGALAKTTTEGF